MARPKCGFKKLRIVPTVCSSQYAGHRHAIWDGRPARCPKKGDLYMSGAPGFECAYEAGGDMSTRYFIAVEVPHG